METILTALNQAQSAITDSMEALESEELLEQYSQALSEIQTARELLQKSVLVDTDKFADSLIKSGFDGVDFTDWTNAFVDYLEAEYGLEGIVSATVREKKQAEYKKLIKRLRTKLEAENISMSELVEIDSLADELRVQVSPEMMASDVLDAIEAKLKAIT